MFGWTCYCSRQISGPYLYPFVNREMIAIGIMSGGREPTILGKRRPRGSGMVPFERALVNSYRPPIVTFPLFLHVSEIIPLLCSSMPLFPTPLHLPQISPCFPGRSWMAFRLQKATVPGYLSKIFNLCAPDPPTLQTGGRMRRKQQQRTACACYMRYRAVIGRVRTARPRPA